MKCLSVYQLSEKPGNLLHLTQTRVTFTTIITVFYYLWKSMCVSECVCVCARACWRGELAHLLCRCQIERYVVSGMWRHARLLCIIQHFRKERIASSSLQLLMGKVGWHQVSLCLQEWRERRREGEREKTSVCSTHFSLGISIKNTVSSFTYVI